MPIELSCEQCGLAFKVRPARASLARFCSMKCRSAWRTLHFRGDNNPKWREGLVREKNCQNCGNTFSNGSRPITHFSKRKFCSSECAKEGQTRLYGEDNPRWKPDARRKNRRGRHGSWARAVISRDKATCQRCGATEVELHAHHIKPYADHPDLRWDLDNGETLCFKCHWAEHAVLNENAVNSGNTLTGSAEGNPEPNFGRKPIEGVTTRGRAYRRWNGECDWCGAFISKRWSDTKGKKHLFCSRTCAAYHNSNTREYCKPAKPKKPPKAVTSSTSAARESDDIVWTCGKP